MATYDTVLPQKDAAGKWLRRTLAAAARQCFGFDDDATGIVAKHGCIYSNHNNATIANSSSEASLISGTAGKGTLVIPANTLQEGALYRATVACEVAYTGAGPTFTMKGTLDTNTVGGTMIHSAGGAGPYKFNLYWLFAVRSIGAAGVIEGHIHSPEILGWNTAASGTHDTTQDLSIDLRGTFSAADPANTFTGYYTFIEKLS